MFRPKTAKNEYDPSMLPQNRKEVFFDVMKLNFGKMLMFGFLMLLFAFPLHGLALVEDLYQMQLSATLPTAPSEEQAAKVLSSIMTLNLVRNALNIPLLVLFSIGLAGLARIIRQFAWGETVDFSHDFSLGIRQNGKQFALLALLAGLVAFVCNYLANMSATIVSDEIFEWLGLIPGILCAVFLIPIAGYAVVACTCYENRLRHNLKIGRICYFKYLWTTLLACICCLAVFIIQLLPLFWCHLIGRLIGSLLIPEIMLGWYLFALKRFDEVVNKKLHPELVDKGLYRPAEKPQGVKKESEHNS